MSSVRDRIRNLQQDSSSSTPSQSSKSTSVNEIAKNLESQSHDSSSSSTTETLSSRVAKFDASKQTNPIPPSRSLFVDASSIPANLKPSNIDTPKGPLARKTESDNEKGRVASRVRVTEITSTADTKAVVNDALKVFEKTVSTNESDEDDDKQKPSILSLAAAFEDTNPPTINAPINNNSNNSQNPPFTTKSSSSSSSTFKVKTSAGNSNKENNNNDDGLLSRTAIFERQNNGNSTTNTGSTLKQTSSLKSKNSQGSSVSKTPSINASTPRNSNNSNNNNNSGNIDNSDLKEQLAEVKGLNNKLVKSLIDLTENYRRLEISRDSLQKRISELEAASK